MSTNAREDRGERHVHPDVDRAQLLLDPLGGPSTASASLVSTSTYIAVPPAARTSSHAARSPTAPRASSATARPWRPNATALARPTPADAPVTTARRAVVRPVTSSLRGARRVVVFFAAVDFLVLDRPMTRSPEELAAFQGEG